ncbi:MAG: hypothetical protein QNJ40_17220 [Xanthomonadales bacterium]|nr:hypothetical protein [Xanthomonadales bacterium]
MTLIDQSKRLAHRVLYLPALLALLLALLLASPAQAQVYQLRPGLLVDMGQSTAYVMQPRGGVAAVALDSGQTRWQSDGMDRPISLVGGRLVGQAEGTRAGQLTLVTLDGQSGQQLGTAVVQLESQVLTSVDQGLGVRFDIQAQRPDSVDQIDWRFQRRTVKGAPIGPEPTDISSQGALRMNLTASTVTAINSVANPWDSAAAIEETLELDGVPGRQFRALGGAHLLASQRRVSDSPADRYLWQIYDRDGTALGRFSSMVSFTPFLVRDGIVLLVNPAHAMRDGDRIVETPLSLVAVDLASGKPRWIMEIRDTRYRGPLPS